MIPSEKNVQRTVWNWVYEAVFHFYRPRSREIMHLVALFVCLFVCLGLLRAHYTPLQRYMGYLCTRKAQYALPRRKMHHGAQGRLCFLKNSGDPDDFLFWWFTENTHKICLSGKYLHVFEWVTWLIYRFTIIWMGHTVTIIFRFTSIFHTYEKLVVPKVPSYDCE